MNLKECIRPVSYIQNNTADAMNYDAINMLRLIRLSEQDIAAGHYRPAENVFADIKTKYGIKTD